MQASNQSSNPLVKSIIHTSFGRAVKELGLPNFAQATFVKEIPPFLRSPDSMFEDMPQMHERVWSAVMQGQVIAAEVKEDLSFVFYVQATVGGRGIDVRLVCRNKEWHIDTVVSMYHKPIRASRWFHRSVFTGSVIVAGLLGYVLHGTLQHPVAPGPASSVKPSSQQNAQTSHPATQKPAPPNPSGTQKPTTHTTPKPVVKQLTFQLKQGMSLDDLSQFLKSNHLVKSAVSFDMLMKTTRADRDVRPGTYHFTSDMTQQQLIAVVKHGPANK